MSMSWALLEKKFVNHKKYSSVAISNVVVVASHVYYSFYYDRVALSYSGVAMIDSYLS
jgi:hypothetical protein